jgi:hypothetical protein
LKEETDHLAREEMSGQARRGALREPVVAVEVISGVLRSQVPGTTMYGASSVAMQIVVGGGGSHELVVGYLILSVDYIRQAPLFSSR